MPEDSLTMTNFSCYFNIVPIIQVNATYLFLSVAIYSFEALLSPPSPTKTNRVFDLMMMDMDRQAYN